MPRWLEQPRAVWLIWAAFAALLVLRLIRLDSAPYDPDDLVRLQQVRDLLGGQSWFDVTQYRMFPPAGAAMHWSRLVDLPLAALIVLFGTVLPPAAAEYWASATLPLLWLLAALFLMCALLRRLGFTTMQANAGLLLGASFPLLPAAFAPMRIDHHTPQALLALAGAALLAGAPSRRAASLAGLAMAAWMAISLEGLPVAALVAALYGLRYARHRDTSLAWFLGALALAAPMLSLLTRPVSEFARWCDILLPAHCAAFAAAALVAALLPRLPRQETMTGRLIALALLPLACAPVLLSLLGQCASDPFAGMDPLLRRYWHAHVLEGLPLWAQPPAAALPPLYLFALIPAGLWAAWRMPSTDRERWITHGVLTGGVTLYGTWLYREFLVAQLIAVPLALALLVWLLPRARALKGTLPRLAATLGVLLLVTPLGAGIVAQQLPAALPAPDTLPPHANPAEGKCRFESLAKLPRGHVFATFDSAPAILAKTPHRVEVGGYHRNVAGLRRVIEGFTGDEGEARRVIEASGADYLAVCLYDAGLANLADGRRSSLAQRLLLDDAPAWLERVPGFEGTRLRVYRVRRSSL